MMNFERDRDKLGQPFVIRHSLLDIRYSLMMVESKPSNCTTEAQSAQRDMVLFSKGLTRGDPELALASSGRT